VSTSLRADVCRHSTSDGWKQIVKEVLFFLNLPMVAASRITNLAAVEYIPIEIHVPL
jgi:hypothetical protein